MAHQRHEAPRRNIQRDVLQYQTIAAIGERDIVYGNRAALQRTYIAAIRLAWPVHELKDALTRDHCLLQHRLLSGEFDQRFVQTAEIADKGVKHADFDGSNSTETEQH